jgi:regulator of replication initiation timing
MSASIVGIEHWTCGHVAGSMCRQCYSELAQRAHVLAEQVIEVAEENAALHYDNAALQQTLAEIVLKAAEVEQERDEAWLKIDQLLGRVQ